jgi:hypothetical protein
MVNQVLVGLRRSTSNQHYGNAFTFSSLGMNAPAEINGYPNIWFLDDGFQTGTTSATYFLEEEEQFSDTLSWVKGKHQFTFGGGFTYGRDNMGKFYFEGYVLPLTWADFLLGQGNLFGPGSYSNIYESYAGFGDFLRDWRYKDADGFIQDNFAIAKRLTLNLGLRWEHIGDLGSANGGGNVDVSQLNTDPPAGGSFNGYIVNSNYKGLTPHRGDTGEEHLRVQWRRPEYMESACGVFLDGARHRSVCSSGRYRHVSHYDRGPDESAAVRGSSHRYMECPGRTE